VSASPHHGNPGKRTFPRSARLLRHADFERVYKQGRRHFAAHMTVFYIAREAGEEFRVGLTVSRALGGAVTRNRMKRRLREAIRLTRTADRCPADVVINPKKSLLTADFSDLLNEVDAAFAVIRQKLGNFERASMDNHGSR
jgi:ribonuclease P protein component